MKKSRQQLMEKWSKMLNQICKAVDLVGESDSLLARHIASDFHSSTWVRTHGKMKFLQVTKAGYEIQNPHRLHKYNLGLRKQTMVIFLESVCMHVYVSKQPVLSGFMWLLFVQMMLMPFLLVLGCNYIATYPCLPYLTVISIVHEAQTSAANNKQHPQTLTAWPTVP